MAGCWVGRLALLIRTNSLHWQHQRPSMHIFRFENGKMCIVGTFNFEAVWFIVSFFSLPLCIFFHSPCFFVVAVSQCCSFDSVLLLLMLMFCAVFFALSLSRHSNVLCISFVVVNFRAPTSVRTQTRQFLLLCCCYFILISITFVFCALRSALFFSLVFLSWSFRWKFISTVHSFVCLFSLFGHKTLFMYIYRKRQTKRREREWVRQREGAANKSWNGMLLIWSRAQFPTFSFFEHFRWQTRLFYDFSS